MIKELIKESELKEEQKVLNKIHEKNKLARMNLQMERQLQDIKNRKQQKKEQKKSILLKAALGLAIITIIILGFKYNEKQIDNCMEAGNNETFCRYAGE